MLAARSTRSASRWSSRRADRTSPSPTSWRRARPGSPTTSAPSRSPPGTGSMARRARRGVRGRPRRLLRDPGQGARRSAGRGLRRAAARARPPRAVGLRDRRGADQRRDLIAERYQGIRPAPGYPACPDHTEKGTLFELLEAESRAGMQLTESFAMLPGASVSGYYFWHPAAATTSGSGGSARPARGLRRAARACRRRGGALARAEPAG